MEDPNPRAGKKLLIYFSLDDNRGGFVSLPSIVKTVAAI
jgi:hypothetical protein